MATEEKPPLAKLLAGVDWPTLLHRGAVLVRAYRGDSTIAADTEREQHRAATAKTTIEKIARAAIGCAAPNACNCAICREQENRR